MGFLEVNSSLTGRCWTGPDPSTERLTEAMIQQTGHPRAVCALLVSRGISAEGSAKFLNPQLRVLLPDPRTCTTCILNENLVKSEPKSL